MCIYKGYLGLFCLSFALELPLALVKQAAAAPAVLVRLVCGTHHYKPIQWLENYCSVIATAKFRVELRKSCQNCSVLEQVESSMLALAALTRSVRIGLCLFL